MEWNTAILTKTYGYIKVAILRTFEYEKTSVGITKFFYKNILFFFKLFINRKCSCMNFDWIWMISYQKGISKIDNDYYSVSSKMYDLNHEEFQKR